ncbi:c-type cytochrome [Limimaricola pyoseonensis]|uniref:Cytochrome c n=1 Tax=Limimaricola pyoseonensis TaxID=521013 RepID=A0A1G7JJJ6_9RHOB|nr:cytochrome c [Limimaricola pyoseonensis]SDF25066.1 Cytochrome c [Limimaricola pyoseonensis]
MRPFLPIILFIAGAAQAQEVEDPLSIRAGHDLYMVFCQSCHGAEARGDGPFAEVLKEAPPDLTRLSERNGGNFPVARATRQIDGRAPLPGHGGEMPIFGPVFDSDFGALSTQSGQPVLTSQSITDLIHWLETIQVSG